MSGVGGVAPEVEAEARGYLRWFPEWLRDVRGEEAVGLVLDQLPPDAEHLPLRFRLDLIRAGLHARRRGAPPMRVWGAVSSARRSKRSGRGASVPIEWRPWLVTKLRRRSFAWQCAFWGDGWLWIYSMFLALNATRAWDGGELAIALGIGLMLTTFSCAWFFLFRRKAWRAELLAANGLGEDGRPLPPGEVGVVWVKPTFQNVWVRPFAIAATVASLAAPITWAVLGKDFVADETFRPTSWTIATSIAVVAVSVAWTRARVRRVGAEPTGGTGPLTRRDDLLLAVVYGGAASACAGFCAGIIVLMMRMHTGVLLAPLVGSVISLGILLGVERSVGRPLGSWDVVPGQGPQQVVRRVEDLPPPPEFPDTPAFG